MRLLSGFFCVALILLVAIVGITIVIRITEKYTLLRNVGRFPLKMVGKMRIRNEPDSNDSMKYQGHRYDRHHVRYNPHVRSYRYNNL